MNIDIDIDMSHEDSIVSSLTNCTVTNGDSRVSNTDCTVSEDSRVSLLANCTNVFTENEIKELINKKHITIDLAIKRDTTGEFVTIAPTTTCKCSKEEQIPTRRYTQCSNFNKHLPRLFTVIYEDLIRNNNNNVLQVSVKTVEDDEVITVFTHVKKTHNEWIYHIPTNINFSVTVMNYSCYKVQLTPIYISSESKEICDDFDILTLESHTLSPYLFKEKDELEDGWELNDEEGNLIVKLRFNTKI